MLSWVLWRHCYLSTAIPLQSPCSALVLYCTGGSLPTVPAGGDLDSLLVRSICSSLQSFCSQLRYSHVNTSHLWTSRTFFFPSKNSKSTTYSSHLFLSLSAKADSFTFNLCISQTGITGWFSSSFTFSNALQYRWIFHLKNPHWALGGRLEACLTYTYFLLGDRGVHNTKQLSMKKLSSNTLIFQ